MVVITRPRDVSDQYFRPTSQDYSHAYFSILKSARKASAIGGSLCDKGGSSAVLILVSSDVDALCATRALVSLLSEDEIPYRVVPVDGYSTLNSIVREDIEGNEDLHTIIFLNLGSLLSLPNYLTAAANPNPQAFVLPDSCTIHLIDSHRPYNLDNIFATSELMERIHVWDDGDIEERLGREAKAYAELEFYDEEGSETESDEGSETEDDDNESQSVADGKREENSIRPKRRRRSHVSEDEESDIGEASGSEEGGRRRHRQKRKGIRNRRERLPPNMIASHRAVLSRYYNRGTYAGLSVSGIIFMLAEKLGRSDNEGLWLAILGLTAQYLSSSVSHSFYDGMSAALASDVIAMNKSPVNTSLAPGEMILEKPANADDGNIRVVKQELRFSLYRHWSLENSMYHSSYVAGKLGIWRERGLSQLRGLMAKMGLSLSQCRQMYEHMDLDLRETLVARIESIAPEYGLTECVYRSFLRSYGYRSSPMSAADAVEGLEALLSAAHGVRIEVEAPGLSFGGVGAGAGGVGGAYDAAIGRGFGESGTELFGSKRLWNLGGGMEGDVTQNDKENRRPTPHGQFTENQKSAESDVLPASISSQSLWVRNFFTAYSALESRKTSSVRLLQSSLTLSKALYRAIISQGVSLIDKQAIKTLRNFRLAVLQDGPNLSLFTELNVLVRLGEWLVSALRDIVKRQEERRETESASLKRTRNGKAAHGGEESRNSKISPSLPFVLAALNDDTNRFLVVGINGSKEFGDVVKNRFGLAFQEAATRSGARTRHDRFETCAVEVGREDFTSFIEGLHAVA